MDQQGTHEQETTLRDMELNDAPRGNDSFEGIFAELACAVTAGNHAQWPVPSAAWIEMDADCYHLSKNFVRSFDV